MAEKRRGLGRGIGALIPEHQKEPKTRPIDVFFGADRLTDESAQEKELKKSSNGSNGKVSAEETDEQSFAAAKKVTGTGKTSTAKSANKATNKAASKSVNKNADKNGAEKLNNVSRETVQEGEELVSVPGTTYGEIPVNQIVPNTKQPRQIFDEDDLEELRASVLEVGVLQPIVVRPLQTQIADKPDAKYELIMGERRWRATTLAGLETVPAIIRHTEDVDLLRDALLENLHRAQLNPLEEAAAYQQLLEDFGCTQEELSRRIARSRPQISNTLRLMKLPPLVQRRVASGVLSAGHARALLGLVDAAAMEKLAQRIVAEGLSVRATEEIVAVGDETTESAQRTRRTKLEDPELIEIAGMLTDKLDTRVKLQMGLRKGKITIDFASIEDLHRILSLLN